MKNKRQALQFHRKLHGKISISLKTRIRSKKILNLLYTPGVGEAVNYISHHKESVYDFTIKKNAVAVVTDGSAVLGFGNVGPEAALPVMEGKCVIFKEFAGIDAYPICLKTQETKEIINTIINISPGFAAINLEDISAPRCFEIESKLQTLGIPVLHDDQHATAIVVLAGLINAIRVVNKKLTGCKIVINGCGAAGSAIARLLYFYGCKNITLIDSKGIISDDRNDLDPYKQTLLKISNPEKISGKLMNGIINTDILIGVSVQNIFTEEMIASMNNDPIVFALANPDPEILPDKANKFGVKIIATGRSDYSNQINNALVFPGFFKGLIKNNIVKITNRMKIRTAQSIADLIQKPSINNIIPSIFDKRLVPAIIESFA